MRNYLTKLLLIIPLVLGLIMFISSCDDTAVNPIVEETIQGVVADLYDNPVSDATIEALTQGDELISSVKTDESGNFSLSFKTKDADNTFIRIRHTDFLEIKENLKEFKKKDGEDKKKYYLQNGDDTCCGKLTIIAKVKNTDSVIKNVQVKLLLGDKLKKVGTTDDNGVIEFTKVCAGNYWVRLAHDKFKVIEEDLSFGDCDTITLAFGMERKDSICCTATSVIKVKNAEGGNVDSALVKFYFGGQVIREAFTVNGQVSFNELCEGKHIVSITKPGMKPIEFYFIAECGGTHNFEKTMQQAEQNDCCGIIKVTVIDDSTGFAVKNAEIRLTKGGQLLSKYNTGEDGIITFTKVCKGSYGLRIAHDLYNVVEKSVGTETNCDSIYQTIKLVKKQNSDTCCNNTMKVTVKDANTNAAINNAKVALWKDGKMVKYAYTENGYAIISNICTGNYGVSINREGYKETEFQSSFSCNQTVTLDKKLTPIQQDSCCAEMKFIILDKTTNAPLKNAEVKLVRANSDFWSKLYTNENGQVIFNNLCSGNYWFRIAKDGYKVKEEDGLTIIEDSCYTQYFTVKLEANQNVDTCCDNKALFKVKDQQGNLLTGAKIKIMRDGQVVYYDSTQQGQYQTPANLCTGKYTYLITYGDRAVDGNFTVGCAQTATIQKVLEVNGVCCTAKIAIFPKDASTNEPINGATVKLWKGGQLIRTLTVENGYVKFVEVCEGNYQISIIHESYTGVEFEVSAVCDTLKEYTKTLNKK